MIAQSATTTQFIWYYHLIPDLPAIQTTYVHVSLISTHLPFIVNPISDFSSLISFTKLLNSMCLSQATAMSSLSNFLLLLYSTQISKHLMPSTELTHAQTAFHWLIYLTLLFRS